MNAMDNTIIADTISRLETKQDSFLRLQSEQSQALALMLEQLKHINTTLDLHKKEQEKLEQHVWDATERDRALEYRIDNLERIETKREQNKLLWEKPLVAGLVKGAFGIVLLLIILFKDKI